MRPIAMNPTIFRNPPKKEKSFLVVNAMKVIPTTRPAVMIPASVIKSAVPPVILKAIKRRGSMIIACATT